MSHPHQWFGGVTHAQHGDDLVLLCIFKRLCLERPSYLDIGAHHPIDLSNTALLYERGSRGINVEANPELLSAFDALRPGDVNVCAAVVPTAGMAKFYRTEKASGRNSLVKESLGTLRLKDVIEVAAVTVNDVIARFAGGRWSDLLSIDTEGLDLPILATAEFDEENAPKVICAEVQAPELDEESPAMIECLASKGYRAFFRCGSNMMFVRAADIAKMI